MVLTLSYFCQTLSMDASSHLMADLVHSSRRQWTCRWWRQDDGYISHDPRIRFEELQTVSMKRTPTNTRLAAFYSAFLVVLITTSATGSPAMFIILNAVCPTPISQSRLLFHTYATFRIAQQISPVIVRFPPSSRFLILPCD